MLGRRDFSYSLIYAVHEGRLERVRELIGSYGLSYSQAWAEGYRLLLVAVQNKYTEVAKLLLTNGSKVNSEVSLPANTPLHFAVKNVDIEIVKMLLDRGADVDAINPSSVTPLHIAVGSKKVEIVELLLNHGACVNARDCNSSTPLLLAAKDGSEEIVKLLLKHGADVNSAYTCTSIEGYTPLCLAVRGGCEKVVKLLLECGANVHAQDKGGKIVLHFAVEKGDEKLVKLLLKCGANIHAQDKGGKSVLHFAVEEGDEEFVKLLLECGANINAQDNGGKTVLHFAVEKGDEKFVKLLLESGANVDAEDKDGETALHSAVEKGDSLIIEHILKHCPDVNNRSNRSALNVAVHGSAIRYSKIVKNLLQYGFRVNPEGVTNYELLHAAIKKGYLKIVDELVQYGIDVNMLFKSTYRIGYMPLHVATKWKQQKIAKLLISYGADVNAQDGTGKNPIFYAIQNGDLKITRLLLTNKANIKVNPELLNIAVLKGHREIVEVLLQHGADVNTSDEYGTTALHCTALCENRVFSILFHSKVPHIYVKGEIAKLLLSWGANVNAQTKDGMTTLHVAAKIGYVKVVEALLEYNADVNCRVNTNTLPPSTAAQKAHLELVDSLSIFGAGTDSKDEYGTTPLHLAARKGSLKVVEVLLKFGACIDSKDECGRTALNIACNGGHKQIVIALLEHGSDINIGSGNFEMPIDFALSFVDPCDYDYDHGHGIDEDVKCHIVKMKAANLFVSKKNLLSFSNNDKISHFQTECVDEIASIKSEKVGNANVSFYDILTKGVSQLAMYAGNESIVQVLRSDDYKVKFPIYASMIHSNFRKGERRKELLEQGHKIFHSLFNNFLRLPHECTEKIFAYLSDEDLRILIDACKPVRCQQS